MGDFCFGCNYPEERHRDGCPHDDVAALRAERDAALAEVEYLKEQTWPDKVRIDALEAEVERLRGHLDGMRQVNDADTARIIAANAESVKMHTRALAAEARVIQLEAERTRASARIKELESHIDERSENPLLCRYYQDGPPNKCRCEPCQQRARVDAQFDNGYAQAKAEFSAEKEAARAEGYSSAEADIAAWLRDGWRPSAGDYEPDLCPNCCTPWKCNSPHLDYETAHVYAADIEAGAHRSATPHVPAKPEASE